MTELGRRVPYVNLAEQYRRERSELLAVIESALESGVYIGGAAVEQFEQEVAAYLGVPFAVALNSGTDALIVALKALGVGEGDEVITPPNSFIASTAAVEAVGARPVFADVLADQNIDPEAVRAAITSRTRAIMPVHLTGRMADMSSLKKIAREFDLWLVEDAAQAFGSRRDGVYAGAAGDVGCFSTHPLKNLNACGDGGFLTTHNKATADYARAWRSHGLVARDHAERFGAVSRMDAVQAAILCYRLRHVDELIAARRRHARLYQHLLDRAFVETPRETEAEFNTYHTFVIQVPERDALRAYLKEQGIGSNIHYPVPIHLQPAAAHLGYRRGDFPATERQAERILTLPINQTLSDEDISYVSARVNSFFRHR